MKRFSIVNKGYNIEEVNNFIDIVIKKLEKLSADNNNYLQQLETLKKQATYNNPSNNIDSKVSKALIAAQETTDKMKEIAAQETTDKMKELAKEEASLIIKEAKENANAIVHEALVNAQKTEQEYELLKKNYNVYRAKIKALIESQLELIANDNPEK